ncbi:S-layer homology domain-containing protein [Sporanaerobium hydrogeniformans]
MMGGSDNKFNPKGNATRAEVSSMLGVISSSPSALRQLNFFIVGINHYLI